MLRTLRFAFAAAAAVAVATPSLAAPPDWSTRDSASAAGYVFRPDGKVLGRDPDVNVRFELMRDGYANEN